MTRQELIEWARQEIEAFPSAKWCSTAHAVIALDEEVHFIQERLEQARTWFRLQPHWPADCPCEECSPNSWRNTRGRELEAQIEALKAMFAVPPAQGTDEGRPPLAPPGCGQIGPRGLLCEAHVNGQHISYVHVAKRTDEVFDHWPLAAGQTGKRGDGG